MNGGGGGVTLYGAYAADVNLDSSVLKDAAVDCSTTWDGSEFQSPTVRTAKEWRNACVEDLMRLLVSLLRCKSSLKLSTVTSLRPEMVISKPILTMAETMCSV